MYKYKHLDIELQALLGQKQCCLQEVGLSTQQLQQVVLDLLLKQVLKSEIILVSLSNCTQSLEQI